MTEVHPMMSQNYFIMPQPQAIPANQPIIVQNAPQNIPQEQTKPGMSTSTKVAISVGTAALAAAAIAGIYIATRGKAGKSGNKAARGTREVIENTGNKKVEIFTLSNGKSFSKTTTQLPNGEVEVIKLWQNVPSGNNSLRTFNKEGKAVSYTKFDSANNAIKRVEYDSAGRQAMEFDSEGRFVKEFATTAQKHVRGSREVIINTETQKTELLTLPNGKKFLKTTKPSSDGGLAVSKLWVDEPVKGASVRIFDKEGKATLYARFDSDKNIIKKVEFDSDGRFVKEFATTAQKHVRGSRKVLHDTKDLKVELLNLPNGKAIRKTTTYLPDGGKKIDRYVNDNPLIRSNRVFSKEGKAIKHEKFGPTYEIEDTVFKGTYIGPNGHKVIQTNKRTSEGWKKEFTGIRPDDIIIKTITKETDLAGKLVKKSVTT